jgi:hypothetical protein
VSAETGRPGTGRPSQDSAAPQRPNPYIERRGRGGIATGYTPAPLYPWPAPSPEAASVPAALRRRQAASRRLTPLAGTGKRDPIAPARRQTALLIEHNDNTAWFYGLDRRQFRTLMRRAGIDRSMWDPGRGTWCISVKDLDSVLEQADQGLDMRTSVHRVSR